MPSHTEADSFTLLLRLEEPDTLELASPSTSRKRSSFRLSVETAGSVTVRGTDTELPQAAPSRAARASATWKSRPVTLGVISKVSLFRAAFCTSA